jgi:hypothetical protein
MLESIINIILGIWDSIPKEKQDEIIDNIKKFFEERLREFYHS